MSKHPTVHTRAAELARLFVGCANEVLALVGVADRCDPEGVPPELVAFVERVRNDALEEAALLAERAASRQRARSNLEASGHLGMASRSIRSLKS